VVSHEQRATGRQMFEPVDLDPKTTGQPFDEGVQAIGAPLGRSEGIVRLADLHQGTSTQS